MELKNLAKFYINEHGLITKTEDTSFIVSGSDNETAIELFIEVTPTTPTDIVVYASFKRADGFVISNINMNLLGATEDGKYYDFSYTFAKDRILDIAGQLEVSFTIKSGNKTINSVSNALYVRRNVKPNLETTTEEEFYQEALEVVEQAQQDINAHKLDFNNPHNVRGDQTKLNADSEVTVDGKITELEQELNKKVSKTTEKGVFVSEGGETVEESTVKFVPLEYLPRERSIPVRTEDGELLVSLKPQYDTAATPKKYVDEQIAEKINQNNTEDVKPYIDAEIQKIVGLAPEELDTLQELADAFKSVGIYSIAGVLTEDQVYDLWNTQVDGRYNITSQKYGMEIIIIQHADSDGKPLFKRMTGGYDYTYDFTLEGWVIASGGGGGGGAGGGTAGIIQLVSISDLQHTIAKGGELSLEFSFTPSIGTKGTLQIYANGVLKKSQAISKGTSNIDVSSFVNVGTNEITFKVSDTVGNQGALVYLVDVIELTLKSNFNDTEARTGDIEFRYTPNGSGAKNITFKIDGNQYGTIDLVQSSGVQQTKIIGGLTHGVHKLEVVAESLINGNLVSSNKLEYNIIYYVEGNNTILISSKFNITEANQGELLSIDYVIYNPTSSTSTVNLLVNGSVVQQNLTQENERKYFFNNTDYPYGNVTFTIDVNGTTKSFVVDVEEAEINVEPITDNLQLYLTAKNRDNTEAESSRNHWVFNDIDTELIDFNWSTNGWKNDTLRFNGKAKATIPFNMFAENFLVNGKTIEFEFATTDVYDLTKVLISCMSGGIGFEITPNTCTIKSTNVTLSTQFKEDEKVRISFVVEKTGELNLVKCLINGVVSGVVEYPNNDIWLQTNPVGISINHNEGSIDIYSIRVYNADLSSEQVLNNYIADMDLADKIQAYTRNNIIDTITQEVSYAKIKSLIPVMTIVGELPITKLGDDVDKPIVKVTFEDPINSNNNFEYEDVEINVQGTSSVDFPRKNYKLKFPMKFSFYEGAVPEKTYTMKADYMESSHSHNTGNAIIMNNISPAFPTQEEGNGVRNAIYGFPIVIFNRPSEDSEELVYYGVFNFNNDKGNSDTIGLTGDYAESWEFKNNISDRCNFKTGDFSSGVSDDFEARYPKDSTNYTNLQRVVSWVVSTDTTAATNKLLTEPVTYNDIVYNTDTAEYRLAKFKYDFEQYFNKEFCLFYYVMMDVLLAVDSRAKNMFLDTVDGQIWYPRWYDMDTAYGLDNEGHLAFSYNLEQTDSIDGISVFNGSDSVLWNNFGEAFADYIAIYYFNLRSSGKLSYDSLMEVLYGHQISKISENMYNTDGQFKYIDIMDPSKVDVIDKSRLYAEQGSRLNHLQWWLNNRFSYLDSKYRYTDYVNDVITMRSYSADNYAVEPSGEFKITPYISMYLSVTYGRNTVPVVVRGTNNVESSISPSSSVNLKNTETAIYNASKILKLDGIPSKYARTMDFHNATRLKELVVGSGVSGYVNNNLTELTVGNLTRLEKLDVQNCPNLTSTLDLSGCLNIKEVYAKGSSIKGVTLADGGNLQTIELPATVTNLSFVNQPFLSNLSVESYSSVKQLRLENIDNSISLNVVRQTIDNLDYVRLNGIDYTFENADQTLLDKLMTKGGLSNTGAIQDKPFVKGKIYIKGTVYNHKIREWQTAFPDLTIVAQYPTTLMVTVIWYDYQGNELQKDLIEAGNSVTFNGLTPTKPDDVQYENYQFTGWEDNFGNIYTTNTITNVTKNLQLTPQFEGTLRLYDVYWYNDNVLLEHDKVPYGETAVYNGATPVHSQGYAFNGWGTDDFVIKGETSFYAVFDEPTTIVVYPYTSENHSSRTPKMDVIANEDYDLVVDWGDGTTDIYSLIAGETTTCQKSQAYSVGGVSYTVKIPASTKFKYAGRILNDASYSSMVQEVNIRKTSISNASNAFQDQGNSMNKAKGLQSLKIYNEDTIIPRLFCTSCYGLKEIKLPDTINQISESAFKSCVSLTTISMPSNITKIDSTAFEACIGLTKIDFSRAKTIPTIITNSFRDLPTTCKIIVPDNLYDDWVVATNWVSLASQIVKASEYVEE